MGNISIICGSEYSQKSIQSCSVSFIVEAFQRITLPGSGYRHQDNWLAHSSTACPTSIFAAGIP